ncbi:uncharacterized protein LOC136019310 [Lathamus discolor]|uniref:uncharacterized protein LOC136019310 n=1 Tax=Lathamus discolor TaxID=678569 RepID=UPI0032B801A2
MIRLIVVTVLIYWLLKLFLLLSELQNVVHYLEPVFPVVVFIKCGAWAKVFVSLYFMAMACNTGGLQQQGEMDVAVNLYPAVPLLFTALALVLASVFVRLRGAEGERPWEPAAAEVARESGPGDQVASGAGPEPGRKAAAEQREEAAEEPSPAEEPSLVAAESVPRKPPAEPQEDAGAQAAFPSRAVEEELHPGKEKLVVGEPAGTAAAPAPGTSTAASLESSEGFEWPVGTLGACLLIVMGISMLAHTQSVFYPRPFCLISEVKQTQVCFLFGVRPQYGRTRRSSPRLDSHEWQCVWDSMSEDLVHWAPPVLWKRRRWKATVWSPQQQAAETAEGDSELFGAWWAMTLQAIRAEMQHRDGLMIEGWT